GLSYHYTSGRPYTNPNNDNGFLGSYSNPFQSLDFSFTYLIPENLFIHRSASNILGFSNVANYHYGNINQDGVYPEQHLLPSPDNFTFWECSILSAENRLVRKQEIFKKVHGTNKETIITSGIIYENYIINQQ